MQVNVYEAKSSLSKLIEAAQKGETVVIAKNGKPAVDIVPHVDRPTRVPGGYSVEMSGFDRADEEIEGLFYGDNS